MLIVIYLLYVKLSETIHINRLLGGRHLFLLNKAEKSLEDLSLRTNRAETSTSWQTVDPVIGRAFHPARFQNSDQ
ncbi:hypothetical protein [Kiloniella sp.]|uniref:hypothetical protein n=1 Tax=Kiloniella sp. TaxID=1938587 RepID=UPI003B02000B